MFRQANKTAPRAGAMQWLRAAFASNRLGDLLVLEGKIAPADLQESLALARISNRRLGQVLLERRLIRRDQLWSTLGKQWGIRSLAWGVAVFISIGSLGPRLARADNSGNSFTIASAAMAPDGYRPLRAYPALFGSSERKSRDLSAFTKWTGMFARYEQQMDESWQKRIQKFADLPLPEMARRINTTLNEVDYIEDQDNWDRSDYWATPNEFLSRGGDCEDFAIAKYMSLRALGVPEERLRIAIVHDTVKNIPHAILIVYTDNGEGLVLDNQARQAREISSVTRYRPIFSINRTGWWLHTRGGDVEVATAAR